MVLMSAFDVFLLYWLFDQRFDQSQPEQVQFMKQALLTWRD